MNKPENQDEDADRFDKCLRAPHNCSVYFGTFVNVFQQHTKLFNPSVSVCATSEKYIQSPWRNTDGYIWEIYCMVWEQKPIESIQRNGCNKPIELS